MMSENLDARENTNDIWTQEVQESYKRLDYTARIILLLTIVGVSMFGLGEFLQVYPEKYWHLREILTVITSNPELARSFSNVIFGQLSDIATPIIAGGMASLTTIYGINKTFRKNEFKYNFGGDIFLMSIFFAFVLQTSLHYSRNELENITTAYFSAECGSKFLTDCAGEYEDLLAFATPQIAFILWLALMPARFVIEKLATLKNRKNS